MRSVSTPDACNPSASAAPTGPPPATATSHVRLMAGSIASAAHQRFDIGNGFRRGGGDDLAAVLRDQRVVLDAHADAGITLGHVGAGPDVAAGLDREHHSGLELAPFAVAL